MFYEDLETLFENCLRHEQALVYGDLGRLPHVVVRHLASCHSHLKAMFASVYYPIAFPTDDLQFRQVDYGDVSRVKCDLLVLFEPSAHSVIRDRYPGAGCLLVLTSHAVLELSNPNVRHAIYFHSAGGGVFDWETRVERVRLLASRMEGSEENDDVQVARHHVNHDRVVTIGPRSASDKTLVPGKETPLLERDAFAIVDLSDVTVPTGVFLYLWDAFDYMAAHLDRVERWSVCFGRNGKLLYDNFVLECIDRLHCSPVYQKHLKRLLPLLPFYKSGTIDKQFDVTLHCFGKHEYVVPETMEEAFKAALAYDTKPLVGGILSVL